MNSCRANYLSQPAKPAIRGCVGETLQAVLCTTYPPGSLCSTIRQCLPQGSLLRNSLQLQQSGISLLDVQRKENASIYVCLCACFCIQIYEQPEAKTTHAGFAP